MNAPPEFLEIQLPKQNNSIFEGQKKLIQLLREKIQSLSEAIIVMQEQLSFYEHEIKKAITYLGIDANKSNMMQLIQILPKQIAKLLKDVSEKNGNTVQEVLVTIEREVEVVKEIEKPVYIDKIVEIQVEVEKVVYLDRIVEKPVYIERIVDQPIYIEKTVEIPIFIERTIETSQGCCKCHNMECTA